MIFQSLVLLRQLRLRHRLVLLDTALSNLVVVIILHLVLMHHVVWLVTLRGLLLQILVLNVRVLYYDLLAFLLDDGLLRFRLHLRDVLCLNPVHAELPILLLGRNSLLLFRWTLVTVFVPVLVVQEAFQGLDELRLLVFNLLFVGVAREVYVLSFPGLFESRA